MKTCSVCACDEGRSRETPGGDENQKASIALSWALTKRDAGLVEYTGWFLLLFWVLFQVKYILGYNISAISIVSFVMATAKKKTPEIKCASSHFLHLHFHEFISEGMCFSKAALAAQNIVVGGKSCPSTPNKWVPWGVPCEMPFPGCFVFSRSACLLTLVPFSFLSGLRGPQGQVSKFTSVIHCKVYTFGIFFLILRKGQKLMPGSQK